MPSKLKLERKILPWDCCVVSIESIGVRRIGKFGGTVLSPLPQELRGSTVCASALFADVRQRVGEMTINSRSILLRWSKLFRIEFDGWVWAIHTRIKSSPSKYWAIHYLTTLSSGFASPRMLRIYWRTFSAAQLWRMKRSILRDTSEFQTKTNAPCSVNGVRAGR